MECRGRPLRKPAASVSDQSGECVAPAIRRDDVQFPVLIDVHEMNAARVEFNRRARGERRTGGQAEAAPAIADENIHGVTVAAGYNEVENFIAVDVAKRNVSRRVTQGDLTAGGGGKPSCSVAELRRQLTFQQMTSHKIEPAIAIEIRERHLSRAFSNDRRRAWRRNEQRTL